MILCDAMNAPNPEFQKYQVGVRTGNATGWTAIMIYDGALAADGVLHIGNWVWALVIGVCLLYTSN